MELNTFSCIFQILEIIEKGKSYTNDLLPTDTLATWIPVHLSQFPTTQTVSKNKFSLKKYLLSETFLIWITDTKSRL